MNSDGTMQQVKGTKTGVSQIRSLDPFTTVRAATFSHEGGIQIEGSGNSTVSAEKGDWFRVTGVDCKSASAITVKASAQSGGIIKVCTGTACHVRKSEPIYNALREELKLTGKKKTSDDGKFTLETVACLGACGLAPVMTIDGEVHSKMTPEAAVALVDEIRRKEA